MWNVYSTKYYNSSLSWRIQQLTTPSMVQEKTCSPTLKELRENSSNRVQKLSKVFERQPWNFTQEPNWWLNLKSPSLITHENYKMPPSHNDASFIKRLLDAERAFMNQLNFVIHYYIDGMENPPEFVPKKLHNLGTCLFGDLKGIYELHKSMIYPELFNAGSDSIKFIKEFIRLIDNGLFYCYISYQMSDGSARKWRENFIALIEQMKNHFKSDYNVDPIGHIKMYQKWINDVTERLRIYPQHNESKLIICREASSKIAQLLETLEQSKFVSSIIEVTLVPIECQLSLFHLIKDKLNIRSPILFLIPRHDVTNGYQPPIDIMQLGNFITTWEFPMLSETNKCYYNTKFLIFQCCVIYTILINEQLSMYNGHFWLKDCKFETVLTDKSEPTLLTKLMYNTRSVWLDNSALSEMLRDLQAKHGTDEISAEIDLKYIELKTLVDSIAMSPLSPKRWSLVPFRSSF